jgi:hypothetical protein
MAGYILFLPGLVIGAIVILWLVIWMIGVGERDTKERAERKRQQEEREREGAA